MSGVLAEGGSDARARGMDVLLAAVQHDATPLREFLLRQPNHHLFTLLVQCAFLSNSFACQMVAIVF